MIVRQIQFLTVRRIPKWSWLWNWSQIRKILLALLKSYRLIRLMLFMIDISHQKIWSHFLLWAKFLPFTWFATFCVLRGTRFIAIVLFDENFARKLVAAPTVINHRMSVFDLPQSRVTVLTSLRNKIRDKSLTHNCCLNMKFNVKNYTLSFLNHHDIFVLLILTIPFWKWQKNIFYHKKLSQSWVMFESDSF